MSARPSSQIILRLEGVVVRPGMTGPEVVPGMAELLREMGPLFPLWLYGEQREGEGATAAERLRLDSLVPRFHWIFASEDLPGDAPERLVTNLMVRTGADRDRLLWVDDRPAMTSSVIRAGMNAVVFVDAFRLRRNLVLRGLLR
jgi:hypothetical protein